MPERERSFIQQTQLWMWIGVREGGLSVAYGPRCLFHMCSFLTFAEKGLDRKLVWAKLPHGEEPLPLGCLGSRGHS